MKTYELHVKQVPEIKEEIQRLIVELRFNEKGKYLFLHLIFDYLPNEEELYELVRYVATIDNSILVKVSVHKNDVKEMIIFGDIDKNTTIYCNENIKIMGTLSGNVFSSKAIEVYANHFHQANVFMENTHFFVEDEMNYLVCKKD